MSSKEMVYVRETKVKCDGGELFGHPLVYLEIKEEVGHIDCPYCGKIFKYKPS